MNFESWAPNLAIHLSQETNYCITFNNAPEFYYIYNENTCLNGIIFILNG